MLGRTGGLALWLLLTLAACGPPEPDAALAAQHALMGMPKETLLSCAGVPMRTATVDNREWFTYHSEGIQTYLAPPPIASGFGRRPWGWDAFDDRGSEIVSLGCNATFTLHAGRVERLDYTSAQGVVGNRQCAAIVTNCLALVPTTPVITTPLPPAAPR